MSTPLESVSLPNLGLRRRRTLQSLGYTTVEALAAADPVVIGSLPGFFRPIGRELVESAKAVLARQVLGEAPPVATEPEPATLAEDAPAPAIAPEVEPVSEPELEPQPAAEPAPDAPEAAALPAPLPPDPLTEEELPRFVAAEEQTAWNGQVTAVVEPTITRIDTPTPEVTAEVPSPQKVWEVRRQALGDLLQRLADHAGLAPDGRSQRAALRALTRLARRLTKTEAPPEAAVEPRLDRFVVRGERFLARPAGPRRLRRLARRARRLCRALRLGR